MYRIDSDGSVAGAFSDGNPQTGQEGTLVPAAYLTELQETICRAIELAGIALVKGETDQLYQAMHAIAVGVAGVGAGPGAVPTTRVLGVGGLVQGGGALSADRSFTVPAASAADVIAGTRPDAAVTPLALAGAFSGSLADSGWSKLPGGLILQWGGSLAYSAEGVVEVDFPIAFPTKCLRAVATCFNATASNRRDVWAQIVSKTQTGLTVYYQSSGTGGDLTTDGFDYIAFGF